MTHCARRSRARVGHQTATGPVTPTRSHERWGRAETARTALGEALVMHRRTRVRFPPPPPTNHGVLAKSREPSWRKVGVTADSGGPGLSSLRSLQSCSRPAGVRLSLSRGRRPAVDGSRAGTATASTLELAQAQAQIPATTSFRCMRCCAHTGVNGRPASSASSEGCIVGASRCGVTDDHMPRRARRRLTRGCPRRFDPSRDRAVPLPDGASPTG
jgi:hypothetical protein